MNSRYLAEILKGQGKDPRAVDLPEEMRRDLVLLISKGRESNVLTILEKTMGLNSQDAMHVLMFQVKRLEVEGAEDSMPGADHTK